MTQRMEVSQQLLRALVALARIPGKASLDHSLDFIRYAVTQIRRPRDISVRDSLDHLRRLPDEWPPARHHLEEHHPQRPEIAPMVRLSLDLLRRHVAHRTHARFFPPPPLAR